MTRLRTRLAGALAAPLVLTACGAVDSLSGIAVPARVAELDLLELLGSAVGPAATDEHLACVEQAQTQQDLEACGEPA